jgi:hypothetical protein
MCYYTLACVVPHALGDLLSHRLQRITLPESAGQVGDAYECLSTGLSGGLFFVWVNYLEETLATRPLSLPH